MLRDETATVQREQRDHRYYVSEHASLVDVLDAKNDVQIITQLDADLFICVCQGLRIVLKMQHLRAMQGGVWGMVVYRGSEATVSRRHRPMSTDRAQSSRAGHPVIALHYCEERRAVAAAPQRIDMQPVADEHSGQSGVWSNMDVCYDSAVYGKLLVSCDIDLHLLLSIVASGRSVDQIGKVDGEEIVLVVSVPGSRKNRCVTIHVFLSQTRNKLTASEEPLGNLTTSKWEWQDSRVLPGKGISLELRFSGVHWRRLLTVADIAFTTTRVRRDGGGVDKRCCLLLGELGKVVLEANVATDSWLKTMIESNTMRLANQ